MCAYTYACCVTRIQPVVTTLYISLRCNFFLSSVFSEDEPDTSNDIDISTAETVEAIVSQLMEKQRMARQAALVKQLECGCPDSTCADGKACSHPMRRITSRTPDTKRQENQVSSTTPNILVGSRLYPKWVERRQREQMIENVRLQQQKAYESSSTASLHFQIVPTTSQAAGNGNLMRANMGNNHHPHMPPLALNNLNGSHQLVKLQQQQQNNRTMILNGSNNNNNNNNIVANCQQQQQQQQATTNGNDVNLSNDPTGGRHQQQQHGSNQNNNTNTKNNTSGNQQSIEGMDDSSGHMSSNGNSYGNRISGRDNHPSSVNGGNNSNSTAAPPLVLNLSQVRTLSNSVHHLLFD